MGSGKDSRMPINCYLAGFFITNVGVGAFTLITGLTLFSSTGNVSAFAWLLSIEFAIGILGQIIGGSLIDRVPVLNVALVSNSIRGVVVLVGGLLFAWLDSIEVLAIVFLISALTRPIYRTSSFVLARQVSTEDQLPKINSLRFGLLQVAQIVGLGVAAVLNTVLDSGYSIAIISLFFVSGVIVFSFLSPYVRLMTVEIKEQNAALHGIINNWRQIIVALIHTPGAFIQLLLGAYPVIALSILTILVAPVNASFSGGSVGIVLLDGSASIGAFAAILLIRRLSIGGVRPLAASFGLAIGAYLSLSQIPYFFGAVLGFLLLGFAAAFSATSLDTKLQLRSDVGILGRVATSQEIATSVTAIILVPMAGQLIGDVGLNVSNLIYAAVTAAYLLLLLISALFLQKRLFGQRLTSQSVSSRQELKL